MAFNRERLDQTGFMPPWVKNEHLARYNFAANFVKGKSVVDCACGDGTGAEIFWKAGAASLEGFDLSGQAISSAKTRAALTGARFQVAPATQLPLPDRSADVYISLESIEHFEEDRAFLKEVVRVLKPDGTFICSTPNRAVTCPGASISDKPWNPFHIREYSQREFEILLGEHFGRVEPFGQNPRSELKVRAARIISQIRPGLAAVRFNQALKLPLLIFDRLDFHSVKPIDGAAHWEYSVAVCSAPALRK